MNDGRPRKLVQSRAEETRARILSTARNAFAENGFDGANMRDIAAMAGVTHPVIKYHFGNKESLWRASVRDMFETLSREMALDDGKVQLDTADGYRTFVRRYIRYCAQHPEHARIMIAETVRGGERLKWMVDEFIRPTSTSFVPHARSLMDQGVLPETWMLSINYIVTAMCQSPFVMAPEASELFGVDVFTDEAIEAHTESVLRFLFPGWTSDDPDPWPSTTI
ncbi:MAG: TetR/AcrR family transcriptional regulator [Pseudomonadota bacterium]